MDFALPGEIEESENKEGEEDTATAKHLTFLRLHFDEKRRQIEAEKRRNQEQWEEERRKLGETLFWYSIGRAQGSNGEPGTIRPGQQVCRWCRSFSKSVRSSARFQNFLKRQ